MEKLASLLLKLIDRTEEGKVDWERSAREGFFQAVFPGYTVQIGKVGEDFVLRIYNEENELVEQVTDPQLVNHMNEAFKVMGQLHSSARRRAMGVDNALQSLLDSLSEEAPF